MSATDLAGSTGSWRLDPARTTIEFRTKAMWVFPVKGRFAATEGEGTVSGDGAVTGTLVIDASSVSTGIGARDKHLRSADFLDVERHPTITFTARSVAAGAGGGFEVGGDLTVGERTRPVTLPVEVQADGEAVKVTGEVDIDRTDWGITWAKMGAGVVNHARIDATFVRA